MTLTESRDIRSILHVFQKSRGSGFKPAMEDVRSFAKFMCCTEDAVLEMLFGKNATEEKTKETILRYQRLLEENGKAPGTISRRVGAIRTLARIAKGFGFISWTIETESLYRNTRGLSASAERKIQILLTRSDPRSRRDLAVLAAIHELDSTRSETAALDLENYDPDPRSPTLKDREKAVAISVQSKKILDAWVEVRGLKAGPLFTKLDKSQEPTNERLSADDLIPVVRDSFESDDLD